MSTTGRVHQLSVSNGGVPKTAVDRAKVTADGIDGDRQKDTRHHGGPMRAVCLFSVDVIEHLRAEGHPIEPGTAGENITVRGIDWSGVVPGTRFVFGGGVELEVTQYTEPCSTIRNSFNNLEFRRIKQELRPGESRVYAKVVREGVVETDRRVVLVQPGD